MATINTISQLTLVELAKRKDPDGNLAVIAENLTEDNPIVDHAVWIEANDTFSHVHTQRTGLPAGADRKLNEGVAATASQTRQVRDVIGMIDAISKTDKVMVDASPTPNSFRMQEAKAFIEGMSQTLANRIFYSNNGTDPERMHGLAPRMASLAATTNVIGAGGSGSDLTSIYLVQWSPSKVHMVYPRNHSAFGIEHDDRGIELVQDESGNDFRAYVDYFSVKGGLVVRDARSIARYANIETSGSSNIFDEDELLKLQNRMPNSGAGVVAYCNETVKTQMQIALKDKTNVYYTANDGDGLSGVPVLRFNGMRVEKSDAITKTESALT